MNNLKYINVYRAPYPAQQTNQLPRTNPRSIRFVLALKVPEERGKRRGASSEVMSEKCGENPMFSTPKRRPKREMEGMSFHGSPPMKDNTLYPWNWSEHVCKVEMTSPCCGHGGAPCESPDPRGCESRRGRPRADVINTLIIEGAQSPSSIKCPICNRVFPREKSLQAHLRTHTGTHSPWFLIRHF